MAKKPLRRPDIPPGRRLDLFLFLQDQVLRNGDKPLTVLARAINFSHQTIYKALTGPRVPSQTVVRDIATYLGQPTPETLVNQALALWADAVAEERGLTVRARQAKRDDQANTELATFKSELSTLWKKSGYSLQELSARTKVPVQSINNYVKGRSVPRSDERLVALLDALDVAPEQKRDWLARFQRLRQAPGLIQ